MRKMSETPNGRLSSYAVDFVKDRHDTYPFIDPKRLNLSNKTVLVTGASRGIGKSTEAETRRKAGFKLLIVL